MWPDGSGGGGVEDVMIPGNGRFMDVVRMTPPPVVVVVVVVALLLLVE